MIVCIEGCDAAGKATQSTRLAERLSGIRGGFVGAVRFSFPAYETPLGTLISEHLRGRWQCVGDQSAEPRTASNFINATVFQALQTANRLEFAAEIKSDDMARTVILDRYWMSGYVYGTADGLDSAWLLELHRFLPQPKLAILLDIDPKDSVRRRPNRRDRYERDELMAVRARIYRDLWDRVGPSMYPEIAWRVVNARRTPDEVFADIVQPVTAFDLRERAG